MELVAESWMLLAGAALILLGLVIRWRTSRYDLNDAIIGSAWQAARGKRSADNPTEVEKRLKDIASRSTAAGKVTSAASTVIGHFFAQVMGGAALLMMLAGAGLIAAGLWW